MLPPLLPLIGVPEMGLQLLKPEVQTDCTRGEDAWPLAELDAAGLGPTCSARCKKSLSERPALTESYLVWAKWGFPRLETTQPLLMFLSGLRLRFHLPTTAAPLGPMDLNSPEYNRRLGGRLGGAEISGPRGVRRPVFAWIELFFHINELPGTIKEFLLATDGIHNQLHGQHSLTWIFARLHPATGVPVCSVDVVSALVPQSQKCLRQSFATACKQVFGNWKHKATQKKHMHTLA